MSGISVDQPIIPPVAHAIGGSIGSALSLLLLYPLERARIDLQATVNSNRTTDSATDDEDADTDVWHLVEAQETDPSLTRCIRRLWDRQELYRGAGPLVTTLAVSNFVFFYVHTFVKGLLPMKRRNSKYWALIASCLAGICNVLITNPLWVANLRIVTGEASSDSSLWKEMKLIMETKGMERLWSGTGTSLLLVSNPVIQFFAYDQLKQVSRAADGTLPPLQAFVAGAVSKALATVLTYPLQLAQTVLRMQKNKDEYGHTWDCLLHLYKANGLKGLFTGMRAKLLQTVLTAAFTFLTYEQTLHVVHSVLVASSRRKIKAV
jgi:adenine nucleotide transporter 17